MFDVYLRAQSNFQDMFDYTGIVIAMDNAISEIKKIADITTHSNEEDGITKFLIDYFQISPTAIHS